MRLFDARDRRAGQRATHLTRQAENNREQPARDNTQSEQSPARAYSSISTERIMQAVEQQRRVSQQLEDLRVQQKQRTFLLRTRGLKFICAACCVCGLLVTGFLLLLILQPALLDRTLNALDGSIALLVVIGEQIRLGLSVIPSNQWLVSGAALVVVLMMGLWIRLMRHPQEV